jgi:hypothetical protein
LVFPDLEGKVKRRAVDLPPEWEERTKELLRTFVFHRDSTGHRKCVVYQRDERQYVVCETCGFGVSAPLPMFSPHPL